MVRPRPLHDGARVAVVSPAGPVVPDILEAGLDLLRDWGVEVELDESVYSNAEDRGYLAGEDAVRVRAVQHALDDDDIDAIIFSRGGYGTMRILPELDFTRFRQNPKLLVGFSDLTALHLYVAGKLDIPTLHAPVVKSMRMHQEGTPSFEALRNALFGKRERPFVIDGLDTIRNGRVSGRLLGGNMTLLVHMLASPLCPDLSDAILLLEDVGEEDYRLDRMFTALRLSEKARRPAGLLLGDFTDCGGAFVDDPRIDDFVSSLAAELDVPAVADFPCGHGDRNLAVPMGTDVRLDATEGRIEFLDDATSTN